MRRISLGHIGATSGLFALFAFAMGCSSIGSSAVRTDGLTPLLHVGQVRVYGIAPPANTRVVGAIEVHAANEEASIETLIPVFMRRAAEVGGTGAVIDNVKSGYDYRTEMRAETYAYACGYRQTCYRTRFVPFTYEIRILQIEGRAIVPEGAASVPGAPAAVVPSPAPRVPSSMSVAPASPPPPSAWGFAPETPRPPRPPTAAPPGTPKPVPPVDPAKEGTSL